MNLSKIEEATKGKTRTTGVSPFMELKLSRVYPNPDQPRKHFTQDEVIELASAIKQDGLLQPIVVVKKDDGYMIVSGERRYKAHLHNNALTIKSHIIQVDDAKVLELALIENIQREDLTDFEIAMHIHRLWISGKYNSKKELAEVLGKAPSYLSKAFGCLKLDENIIADIEKSKRDLPLSVMEELSRVKDQGQQQLAYQKYTLGQITREDIKSFKVEREKKFKESDTWTLNQFNNYFMMQAIKHIEEGKTYKITIEEV